MSFDSSRFTFNPWNDFLGVVMEQGRVQLDSDWNEWQAEFARRVQAGTLDTIGRAVYPATTPYAFQIGASIDAEGNNHIAIGAGRYYVDGLLAENHGPAASAQWDPALAEMSGAPQIPGAAEVTVDYTDQPYFPQAALPTGNGSFLAYLDVWRRAVTYLEDPNLVEKAVGVDTTGRLQTVWQVKLLDVSSVSGGVDCATPDAKIPPWAALIQPSAGQLTNALVQSTASGPCCLTQNTGYTGMENQLYRVEIHQSGTPDSGAAPLSFPLPPGTATFKWSRDNASVSTSVSNITSVTNSLGNPASQLTVASLGRDQMLGFTPGNWIEITDDYRELNGLPGELHKIDTISAQALTITLDSTISITLDPSDPTRHTRILRWDQAGKVYLNDAATVWVDLDSTGSTGDIPVPPAGTALILENGITVSFGLNPAGGSFYNGDFWTFAARTADGSIEPLIQAPPQGIHHHYARLAVVTSFSSSPLDCRIEWPPSEGGTCGCVVTVEPGDITANTSLQTILNQYTNLTTPATICLAPGIYNLNAPLRFASENSNISLQACQPGTVVIQAQSGQEGQFFDGLIVLDGVNNVTLSGLQFSIPLVNFSPSTFAGLPVTSSNTTSLDPTIAALVENLVVSIGVRPVNCTGITIENCQFDFADFEEDISNANAVPFGVGIFASGPCTGLQVQNNQFAGIGDFLAGFLLAPSVSFKPATIFRRPPIRFGEAAPISETPVLAESAAAPDVFTEKARSESAGQFVATPKAVKAKAAKLNPVLEESGAINTTTETLSGLATLGNLQNILNLGTATPNLAANGGTVVSSTLNDTTFKDNSFSGMTVAVFVLGKSEAVEFIANEVEGCNAGFWLLSPLRAETLLSDSQNLALLGASIAMAYPLPQGDTTTPVTVAAAPASLRVYTGKTAYTDSQGNAWTPDATASSSFTEAGGMLNQPVPPPAISGSSGTTEADPALYQSERFGSSFTYTFNSLLSGYYQLTLKFAELTWTAAGIRLFNVSINGQQVLTNFDVFQQAGGQNIAFDQIFSNVAPTSQGQIVVQFTGVNTAKDPEATISAIEIDPQWTGTPSLSQENAFQTFFDELAQLGEQGFAALAVSPLQLRLTDNEMQGLSGTGVLILGDDSVENANSSSLMMNGNRLDGAIAPPFSFLTGSRFSSVNRFAFAARSNAVSIGDAPVSSIPISSIPISSTPVGGVPVSSAPVGGAPVSPAPVQTFFSTPPEFLYIVTIEQVSRCVISANMVLNEEAPSNFGGSLYLNNTAVVTPGVTIIGNLFKDGVQTFPTNAILAYVNTLI